MNTDFTFWYLLITSLTSLYFSFSPTNCIGVWRQRPENKWQSILVIHIFDKMVRKKLSCFLCARNIGVKKMTNVQIHIFCLGMVELDKGYNSQKSFIKRTLIEIWRLTNPVLYSWHLLFFISNHFWHFPNITVTLP